MAALACGACAGASSAPAAEPTPEPATAALDCRLESGPHEVTVEGEDRTYQLHLPEPVTEPVPAVVAFHGHTSSAELIAASTGLDEAGPAAGVAVAMPQGEGDPATWHILESAAGDMAFADALLDDLAADECIDADRLWLAGHSGGSAFAGVYGCGAVDQVAGVWLNAGLPPPICPEDAGIDVRIVHGTADPVVPFDGGAQPVDGDALELDTVPASAAGWAARAGCAAQPTVDAVADAEVSTWDGCAGGATVSLAAVVDGSHVWPNDASQPAYPATCELLAAVVGAGAGSCATGS